MADDDDYSCRQCNKGFLCLRTLRHHQALSTKCGQKRKLDELIDDDAPSDGDANGGDGPQQLQGACSVSNVVTFPLYFRWDGVRSCSLFVRCSYNNRTIIVQ